MIAVERKQARARWGEGGIWWRSLLPVALGAAIFAVPAVGGLSVAGRSTLAVFVFMIAAWITEMCPAVVTALIGLALLGVTRALGFGQALAGFSDSSLWFIFGALLVASGVSQTGLDRRIAYTVLRLAGDRPARLAYAEAVVVILLNFFIPGAEPRVALLLPLLIGIAEALKLPTQGRSNLAVVLFLAAPFAALLSSSGLPVGAASKVLALALFTKQAHYTFSYVTWLVAFLPFSIVASLAAVFMLLKAFPPEKISAEAMRSYLNAERPGRLSGAELRVAGLAVVMVLGFLFQHQLGLPNPLIALVVGLATLVPGIGVQTWQDAEARMNWRALLLFGAVIAVAAALNKTGAGKWLVNQALAPAGPTLGASSLAVLVLLLILFALLHLGLTAEAMTAAFLPIAFLFAAHLHINPVWMGSATVVSTDIAFFLPVEAACLMLTYGAGYYRLRDNIRAGLIVTPAILALVVLNAYLYWPAAAALRP